MNYIPFGPYGSLAFSIRIFPLAGEISPCLLHSTCSASEGGFSITMVLLLLDV